MYERQVNMVGKNSNEMLSAMGKEKVWNIIEPVGLVKNVCKMIGKTRRQGVKKCAP